MLRPDTAKVDQDWVKLWAEIRGGVLLLSRSGVEMSPKSDDRTAFDLVYYTVRSKRKETLQLQRPQQGVTVQKPR